MLRLIFVIVIGVVIYTAWKYLQKIKQEQTSNPAENVEPMVKCNYCNVYAAQKTSTKGTDGLWYCCPDHALRARR